MARQYAEIDNKKIAYIRSGEGPVVLFLHGWGGKAESFAPVYQTLASSHCVVAVDFPGFGDSSEPDWWWGVKEYAETVHKVIDALQLGQVHLVAHSFGCRIAIWLGAYCAQSVSSITLINAAGLQWKLSRAYKVRKHVFQACLHTVSILPFNRVVTSRSMYKLFWSGVYSGEGSNLPIVVNVSHQFLDGILPKIQAPTLIVWGKEDNITPLCFGKKLEGLIPNAALVVLQGGHYIYLEQLRTFLLVLERFLGSFSPFSR